MATTEDKTVSSYATIDFTCKTQDLIRGMDIAKRTLGSGDEMPILAGVKLQVGSERLHLTSTNLEMATTCNISITNEQDAATLVLKGDVLAQITNRLPEKGKARFRTNPEDSQEVQVSCGGIEFELFQLPVEDYPSVPQKPEQPAFTIQKHQFRTGLKQTTFAALKAKETTRLSLTGVNTILNDDQLKLVATNGYRMALKTLRVNNTEQTEDTFLIDAGALQEWDRIMSHTSSDRIEVYASDSEVFFSCDDIVFSDKLIMEQFPEFEGVIPSDNDLPLYLNRNGLLQTLRRAEITANEESGEVKLHAGEGEDVLQLSSSSPEKGEFSEDVQLHETFKGDITVAFKAEFLIDALRRMEGDQIVLWLADSDTAGLMEPVEEQSDFLYVCMPISN